MGRILMFGVALSAVGASAQTAPVEQAISAWTQCAMTQARATEASREPASVLGDAAADGESCEIYRIKIKYDPDGGDRAVARGRAEARQAAVAQIIATRTKRNTQQPH